MTQLEDNQSSPGAPQNDPSPQCHRNWHRSTAKGDERLQDEVKLPCHQARLD
ncbi:hypothetical protein [Bradyrhizobium betae]|uniref:hypothetical protein n=1 Tax=Bradyrhizobium betae TaxID=244734 RepID=UPI0012B68465|nr:hypothetical protein [Bradyrhizobium betae]MCS3726377.1 hypothetical protein [Bradyrhizobium betae]